MALRPKQMGEAIIRNLKDKTGKSLEEWLEIVKQAPVKEKKEVMHFLKTTHNLGHFQAQKIFEHFKGADAYAEVDQFEVNLFSSPESKQRYEAVKGHILKLGKDINVQPCKTYIPFYRKTQFAQLSPAPNNQLKLKLHLPDDHQLASNKGNNRLNAKVLIKNEQLDASVLEALKLAYQNN